MNFKSHCNENTYFRQTSCYRVTSNFNQTSTTHKKFFLEVYKPLFFIYSHVKYKLQYARNNRKWWTLRQISSDKHTYWLSEIIHFLERHWKKRVRLITWQQLCLKVRFFVTCLNLLKLFKALPQDIVGKFFINEFLLSTIICDQLSSVIFNNIFVINHHQLFSDSQKLCFVKMKVLPSLNVVISISNKKRKDNCLLSMDSISLICYLDDWVVIW